MSRIAVIGAGVAGCTAAQRLQQQGHQVQVFDERSQPGGRCCTQPMGRGGYDHGAQFFTARDPRFQSVLQDLARNQWVTHWECRSGLLSRHSFQYLRPEVPRWVGTPRMSSLVLGLQAGLEVYHSVRIEFIHGRPGDWQLHSQGNQLGSFQKVLVTAPAPQSADLLRPVSPKLAEELKNIHYEPCLAALVQLKMPAQLEFDAAAVEDAGDGLGFVTRNNSKPHRAPLPEQWVLHSSVDWARQRLEEDPQESAGLLWRAFCQRTGADPDGLEHLQGYCWRYARVARSLGRAYLSETSSGLAWCGDGALGPRVECAFLSGLEVADNLSSDPS
ncbi:NAD(P)-binding protein [bacterium]|nr:NAD(P)-binding protein [bacterium]